MIVAGNRKDTDVEGFLLNTQQNSFTTPARAFVQCRCEPGAPRQGHLRAGGVSGAEICAGLGLARHTGGVAGQTIAGSRFWVGLRLRELFSG